MYSWCIVCRECVISLWQIGRGCFPPFHTYCCVFFFLFLFRILSLSHFLSLSFSRFECFSMCKWKERTHQRATYIRSENLFCDKHYFSPPVAHSFLQVDESIRQPLDIYRTHIFLLFRSMLLLLFFIFTHYILVYCDVMCCAVM